VLMIMPDPTSVAKNPHDHIVVGGRCIRAAALALQAAAGPLSELPASRAGSPPPRCAL
jgi:hypothetical protein